MPDNIRALTKHVTQNVSCLTKERNLFLATRYPTEELFWKKILKLLPTVSYKKQYLKNYCPLSKAEIQRWNQKF